MSSLFRLLATFLLTAGALLLCPGIATANLLTNGSFENPGATLTTSYLGVGAGTQITGWTTAIGNGSTPNVYYAASNSTASWIPNAQSGNYCVQLDSTQGTNFTVGSSIAQTFTVATAGKYTLSFWINTEVGTGKGGTAGVMVSLSGAATGNLANAEYTVTNPSGVSRANAAWVQYTATFTTTAANTAITLKFMDDTNVTLGNFPNTNVSIDNISVDVFVPEFSHWSVFLGFGALTLAARKIRAAMRLISDCSDDR